MFAQISVKFELHFIQISILKENRDCNFETTSESERLFSRSFFEEEAAAARAFTIPYPLQLSALQVFVFENQKVFRFSVETNLAID